jgi:hypothetical protein
MNTSSFLNALSPEYKEDIYQNPPYGSTSVISKKLSFHIATKLFDINTFNEELLENITIIEDKFNSLFELFPELSANLTFSKNGNYIYSIKFLHPEFPKPMFGDNNIRMGDYYLEKLIAKLDYLIENPNAFDRFITGKEYFIEGNKPFKDSLYIIKDQNGYKTKDDYKYTQDITEAKQYSTERDHKHSLTCDVVHHRLEIDYVRQYVS